MRIQLLILVLMASSSPGLLTCSGPDRGADSLETVATRQTDHPKLRFTTGIRSILEDRQGNVWFGSHNEGAARYADGAYTYYTVADGLSDDQVRSIYEDRDGNIWFECGEGLSIYDGHQIHAVISQDYSVPERWNIRNESLWFKGDPATGYSEAEAHPGVYGYDGKSLRYHKFPMFVDSAAGNQYSVSTPFAEGKNGRVWFGTYSAVVGYDGNSFTLIDNTTLGLSENTGLLHVRSIYEDSRGRLWIGNNGIGVLLRENGRTVNFSQERGLVSPLGTRSGGFISSANTLEHVFAIGEDANGAIWFGDRDTGAWRYDGTSVKNYGTGAGLPVPFVLQIYQSMEGELWFGMEDGSVQRFVNERFQRLF